MNIQHLRRSDGIGSGRCDLLDEEHFVVGFDDRRRGNEALDPARHVPPLVSLMRENEADNVAFARLFGLIEYTARAIVD